MRDNMDDLVIGKLLDYVTDNLDAEGIKNYGSAIHSFVGDILSRKMSDDKVTSTLSDLRSIYGDDIYRIIMVCTHDFFCTNEYPTAHGSTNWNCVDSFIKKSKKELSQEELDYLKAYRNAYMSVYRIVDIKPDDGLTFKNMLEPHLEPVLVHEKLATKTTKVGDFIGARLVTIGDRTTMTAGCLPLKLKAAHHAMSVINKITKKMMSPAIFAQLGGTDKNRVLLIKKMWAKEIFENWLFPPRF